MKSRKMKLLLRSLTTCLVISMCMEGAYGQIDTPLTVDGLSSNIGAPVAFLYVSSTPTTGNEINAFTVAANGRLTPILGSPYLANGQSLALNGKYLFGTDGIYIYSFLIASDGGLQLVSSVNAQQFNTDCSGVISLFPDLTGVTLYDLEYCTNNDYRSFGIDQSTGGLNYLGDSDGTVQFEESLRFVGNNLYGYTANCVKYSTVISGFLRNLDGTLTRLTINPPIPVAPMGEYYCPNHTGASGNNVAISLQPAIPFGGPSPGPAQTAVYTADSAGNLTTSSTLSNMPPTRVGYVTDMAISPAGSVLAVSGTTGLQLFHFNGSNQVSHFTALLTKKQVDQIFWDNHNHLIGISKSAGLLFVFTVTSTGAHQSQGSPHAIASPQAIAVLPKM